MGVAVVQSCLWERCWEEERTHSSLSYRRSMQASERRWTWILGQRLISLALDRASPSVQPWPFWNSVGQAGLEFRDAPASASWVLELNVCATAAQLENLQLIMAAPSWIRRLLNQEKAEHFVLFLLQVLLGHFRQQAALGGPSLQPALSREWCCQEPQGWVMCLSTQVT